MRYLLPLLLVSCGPAVESKCSTGSCVVGKTCNVNTGLCVASGVGGGGGGHVGTGGGTSGAGGGSTATGGGSGGSGGGVAGGSGGGQSESVTIRMQYDVQDCPGATCVDCTISKCVQQATVPLNTFNSWKAGRYVGCQFTSDVSGRIIDCTTNCQQGATTCTTAAGDVQRKTFSCVVPDGAQPGDDVCSWTP